MRKIKSFKSILLVSFVFLFAYKVQSQQPQVPDSDRHWTVEQAQTWSKDKPWLRGSNFNPSTTVNQLEFWQAETFDSQTIDRELGWAENIGLNCMRVFLHHAVWEIDKEGFKKRMKEYLAITDKHKIQTIFVLFDDC